jgi:putative membrane protein
MPMPMWGYYDSGGMGWWMILSSLFWLILAGIIVWAVVRWLSRLSTRPAAPSYVPPQAPAPQPQTALDILKVRYARGEIDAATFRAMRAQIEESATPVPELPPTWTPQGQEPVPSGR